MMTHASAAAPAPTSLRAVAAGGLDLLERFPMPLLQLMARLGIAGVFWRSGQAKIASWDFTVQLFRDEYRVPVLPAELAATLATALELGVPVLLVLGVAARFGAAALLGMTFVIQTFVYPDSWPEHLTWATLLLLILTRGAGPVSIDRLLARFVLGEQRGR